LVLQSIFVHALKGFLTWRKISWHGANDSTSPPRKGELRIIALGCVWTCEPWVYCQKCYSLRHQWRLIQYIFLSFPHYTHVF
jgi:hypothetical protein